MIAHRDLKPGNTVLHGVVDARQDRIHVTSGQFRGATAIKVKR